MVTIIKQTRSLGRALQYNENKVSQGQAALLAAGNFPADPARLSPGQKRKYFEYWQQLNTRSRVNAIHLSLNFSPAEKLPDARMAAIARAFMEKSGLGSQPWLAYRHFDAAHPHLHIVSSLIDYQGRRLPLTALYRGGIQIIRKDLEKAFGLLPASHQLRLVVPDRQPLRPVIYGQSPGVSTLSAVVGALRAKYQFSTLEQWNALLGLYRLAVDAGQPHSWLQQHGGLLYRILDGGGRRVGVPIKASLLGGSPTLQGLGPQMQAARLLPENISQRLRTCLDWILSGTCSGWEQWQHKIEKAGISPVIGPAGGRGPIVLVLIDHRAGWVVAASQLGSPYTLQSIQARLETRFLELASSKQQMLLQGASLALPAPGAEPHGNAVSLLKKIKRCRKKGYRTRL